MKLNFKHTVKACFIGYIVQAIINNYVPLLFITFESDYGIPLSRIALLISFNFGLQLVTDLVAALVVDKVGWRVPIVLAQVLSCLGLVLLAVLPSVMTDKFAALMIAIAVFSVGGGLLEVLISPITEACPGEDKAGAMSLLHSFYCWGYVGVVLLSTLFFIAFGIKRWNILALLWALVPLFNAFFFSAVPLGKLEKDGEKGLSKRKLFENKKFILFIVIMFCAASSELAVAQWVSYFAEKGLHVSKAVGDLAGPMMFAVLMGLSRVIYAAGKRKRLSLSGTLICSSTLCFVSYLVISLSPYAWLSLLGCGVCGFSVGMLWPGTFSLASETFHGGTTAMFALLALFGDMGCSLGPLVVGRTAALFGNNLKIGILVASVFPLIMAIGLLVNKKRNKSQ